MATKGQCMVRGGNDYDYYTPPHPESEAAADFSYSEPEIQFAFGLRYAGLSSILMGYGSGTRGG